MTSQSLSKVVDSIPMAGLDFEYCAVMQTETKSFMLTNPTSSLLQFEIVCDKDNTAFVIEPTTGKLHHFFFNLNILIKHSFLFEIGMLRAG